MSPQSEEEERQRLEDDALVYIALALKIVDMAAVRGGSMTESESAQVREYLTQARDIGWEFVRENAIDEKIGEEVYASRDSSYYAITAALWMIEYSSKLAKEASAGLDGREAVIASRNVLKAREATRAESYAIGAVHAAVEAGKAAVVARVLKILPPTKTWRTVGDSRVRATHRQADGQEVAIDDYFTVGGYSMRYPQDYSAPPKETANCRCMAVYSINWSK